MDFRPCTSGLSSASQRQVLLNRRFSAMYSLFDAEVRTQCPLHSGGYGYAQRVSNLTSVYMLYLAQALYSLRPEQ